jgi:hypothetical protein
MDYSFLHELEFVEFRSEFPRRISELVPVFKSCGFTFHDDVVSIDRKGRVPPWQHSSIVEVVIRRDGEEVFGFEQGEWDVIRLEYLFASLPFALVDDFIDAVSAIADRLGIVPTFQGEPVASVDLKRRLVEVREDLIRATGEDAGSEPLAIFIHSTYPRC